MKKNNKKQILCGILSAALLASFLTAVPAEQLWAAEAEAVGDEVVITEKDKPYLALGADLSAEQKAAVLGYMGISEEALADYDVTYVTNAEEHTYLDDYISSSQIGTHALSSVVITEAEKGSGLSITTYNINYCTVGMYKNALTTAGITDANIIVAGPFELSGTCALVGIMKAYENMTDETLDEELVDGALEEIVTTGELEEDLTDEESEQLEALIADIKEKIANGELDSAEEILEEVKTQAEEYGLSLSEEDLQKLSELLDKLQSLDLDLETIAQRAGELKDTILEWKEKAEKIADTAGKVADKVSEVKDKAEEMANSETGRTIIEKIKAFFRKLFAMFD